MSSGMTSGITSRSYKSGSIVYFEGDKSEFVYILKSGKVILTYLKLESGEEVKEDVKPGEFFGVKSALGKYPREETAQTIGETSVLVLKQADFERYVLGNVAVVKKMLRVFSNQLRRVGKAVREVLGETNLVDPANELFKIGEYYSRNGKYQQALYAYKRYMEYYPDGRYARDAMTKIKSIEKGDYAAASYGMSEAAAPGEVETADEGFTPPSSFDEPEAPDLGSTDFDAEAGGDFGDLGGEPSFAEDSFSFESSSNETTELGAEMNSFLSDDDGISGTGAGADIEDFGSGLDDDLDIDLDNDFAGADGSGGGIEDLFGAAESLMKKGSFAEAAEQFEDISRNSAFEMDDARLFQRAQVLAGSCYRSAGDNKKALTILSQFIKANPSAKDTKQALLEVGLAYQSAGQVDKASPYLKKVASMTPRDDITQQAVGALRQIK